MTLSSSLSILQKNYVLVLLAVLIAVVLTFVMNLVKPDSEDAKKRYIETAVVATIISTFVIWIHTLVPVVEEISLTPPPF